ncbi:LysM peptidoglycan-binding domain-containing protein [Cellulomonas sp. URHD0024]|uniref:LysM peptidoglycan-binding domain-containing protein n=1 Tax=Cellulomonas sp. URHD0024 TaxID=1302620 RepID=UPI0018C913E3|nr:LysM peptidoglycan-binding domain-containing protein [Cellulomonas sp. URHD0024]
MLVEVVAGARRIPTPSLPMLGSVQLVAARLVATTAVLFAVTTSIAASASPSAAVPAAAANHLIDPPHASAPDVPAPEESASEPQAPPTTAVAQLPTITVVRGDTLWDLAERHLGDGTRFTEIRDLNLGRPQSDGQSLTDAHWVYPGWTLLLPPDATGLSTPPPPTSSTPPAGTNSIVVQPGDTLESIAEAHLGHATAYSEIFDLNAGLPQPDGHTLSDPNLIRPGWTLTLPTANAPVAFSPAEAHVATPAPQPSGPESVGHYSEPAPTEPTTREQRAPAHLAPDQDAPSANSDAVSSTEVPFYIGLTALAAAGVIGEVGRRRHLQHRARKVGESIPMPDEHTPAATVELTLRSAPTPVSLQQLKTTLLNLDSRCYTAERDLPRLAALTLDEHTLTLHLESDDQDPVPPFAAQDARTWTASTEQIANEVLDDDGERSEPYPALVTLGHNDAGTILLNLEAAGTLSIVGDDDAADEVLRALAVELVTSDLTGRIGLVAEPWLQDFAEAFEPARFQTTPANSTSRASRTSAIARALKDSGLDDTLEARSDRVLDDTWLPVVFVERQPQGPQVSEPWSGSILLTRTQTEGWSLTVAQDGEATIEPLGIAVRAQRLSAHDLAQVRSLLQTAQPPYSSTITAARSSAEVGIHDDLEAIKKAMLERPATADSGDTARIRVNVLGPIQIDGLPRPDSPPPERITELLVYLALHRQATGHEIDEVFWPGKRVDSGTRNTFVYRTRRYVGDDALPPSTRGAPLRVTEQISTDWAEFHRLMTRAIENEVSRTEDLTAALALVRDRPFLGIDDARYAWAEADIQRMISAIADAAHLLARIHFEEGRFAEALQAATHGLMIEPFSDLLQCDALDAANARGGEQESRRLRERFAARLAELDPDAIL